MMIAQTFLPSKPTPVTGHTPTMFINSSNLVLSCKVHPELHPAGTDHMPTLTELDLTVPRSIAKPTRNFRTADFDKVCATPKTNLDLNWPTSLIKFLDDLNSTPTNHDYTGSY